ncbi:MAG: cytochrome c3 family protein [Caldilineaceae bacterium]|nr:cytochrome c3 family protein [Caldilineaceae bacterium]
MSQIFHPSMNLIAKLSLLVMILLLAGLAWLGYYTVRSPFMTEVGVAKAQPIPYSHAQHVGGLGLDCRYCHTAVEVSDMASIPPTETCMGCHATVAADSPTLELVRNSAATGQPLEWMRVHDLADFVYFNHAIHVQQGVGCETCHGRVDEMPVMMKVQTLQMDWCLDCHRDPAQYVRPREEVFTMGYTPPVAQATLGPQLVADYGIHVDQLTDCSVCHR